MTPYAARLFHRTVIRIGGADRYAFLQGLVSNDVTKATTATAVYAALLTPQGKFLHDLFILDSADGFLVDCETARADDLLRRLNAYKLRSEVTFEDLTDRLDVWAAWENPASFPRKRESSASGSEHVSPTEPPKTISAQTRLELDSRFRGNDYVGEAFPDPRLPELGYRYFTKKGNAPTGSMVVDFTLYDQHRLALGIADGSRDMEIEKSTLAEGNFDYLNGIDWKKGCYVGQELTARMHYRGLAKKRLFPVRIEGTPPPVGTILPDDAFDLRTASGALGLALLKIEAVRQEKPLTYEETRLWPSVPTWMKLT